MLKHAVLRALALLAFLGLAGCALCNKPPVVIVSFAPSDPRVSDDVELDATQTADPEGDPLTFTWSLQAVPPSSSTTIDDPNAPSTYFYADLDGEYTVRLVVDDGTHTVQADFDITVAAF